MLILQVTILKTNDNSSHLTNQAGIKRVFPQDKFGIMNTNSSTACYVYELQFLYFLSTNPRLLKYYYRQNDKDKGFSA